MKKNETQLTLEEIRDRLVYCRNYNLLRAEDRPDSLKQGYKDFADGIDFALQIVIEYCEFEIE